MEKTFNINEEHYFEVWKLRRKNDVIPETYSFKLGRFLGERGKIDHPLVGRKVRRTVTCEENPDNHVGKEYVIESAHVHYLKGYYLMLLIRDEFNSHGQLWWVNYNSQYDLVKDAIQDSNEKFELV